DGYGIFIKAPLLSTGAKDGGGSSLHGNLLDKIITQQFYCITKREEWQLKKNTPCGETPHGVGEDITSNGPW
ncbi:MAG: hypothetical protein IJN58_02820, partial [Clostridia bacterium]|nr:hypothetical protein [Clostridia bacterium]